MEPKTLFTYCYLQKTKSVEYKERGKVNNSVRGPSSAPVLLKSTQCKQKGKNWAFPCRQVFLTTSPSTPFYQFHGLHSSFWPISRTTTNNHSGFEFVSRGCCGRLTKGTVHHLLLPARATHPPQDQWTARQPCVSPHCSSLHQWSSPAMDSKAAGYLPSPDCSSLIVSE